MVEDGVLPGLGGPEVLPGDWTALRSQGDRILLDLMRLLERRYTKRLGGKGTFRSVLRMEAAEIGVKAGGQRRVATQLVLITYLWRLEVA